MNFFAYRLPDSKEIITGKSKRLLNKMTENSFVICKFGRGVQEVDYIPADDIFFAEEMDDLAKEENVPITQETTRRTDHCAEVVAIKKAIDEGKIEKAIASRCLVMKHKKLSLAEMFYTLCEVYPKAFIFCFHTRNSGTWLGASPEVLIRCEKGLAMSMSLAGTRKSGTYGDWDNKNIREQELVTMFVVEKFLKFSKGISISDALTLNAGPVEHRCRYIRGEVEHPMELAIALSPTPALCGFPRDEAYTVIENNEKFSREYYGGFCGPVTTNNKFDLFVNLRSMKISGDKVCLYVGGGITADSDPASEWEETERKSETLIKPLNLYI